MEEFTVWVGDEWGNGKFTSSRPYPTYTYARAIAYRAVKEHRNLTANIYNKIGRNVASVFVNNREDLVIEQVDSKSKTEHWSVYKLYKDGQLGPKLW